jgi:anti-sigma factor RsiW
MNSRDVRPLLARYLEGEIDSYERTLIEQHLTECQGCTAEISQLRLTRRRVQRELKRWADSAVPPASARNRLLAKLTAEEASPSQPITRHHNVLSNRILYRRIMLLVLVMMVIAAFVLIARNIL